MYIRTASDENSKDCQLVYLLSNDETVRKNSFCSSSFSYESHVLWFKKVVKDNNTLFFLFFEDDDTFIGQVRFIRESERSTEVVISISITQNFRGQHVGERVYSYAERELRAKWQTVMTVVANVKKANIQSNKFFAKLGFHLFCDTDHMTWKKNIDK